MTEERNEKKAGIYHPIQLASLRVNTATNFDMYMKRSGSDQKDRFVLYRDRSVPFTERNRTTLRAHGAEELYIDTSDKKEYQVYLEKNLDAIIADEMVPLDKKSEIAYTCATGLVEELLENPRSGERIQRSKEVITNITNYLLDESGAFFSLMATASFDYYTYTHSVNVSVFGIALANRLRWYSREEINTIGSGLIVHDIGKSLMDQRILNKPGKLDASEWAAMKEHPKNGVQLLRDAGRTDFETLVITEGHHEKIDGSGYPYGLKGEQIHPFARIGAIADIFDALTTKRSYKSAEKSFPALKVMRDNMSHGLDQELFREFVQLMGG